MTTKPTTFQNNNKEQQQQPQYQIQTVSRVSQQQQLQTTNHQQQQHNRLLPTYVPGPAIVNNNATMALQQQPQQQDNVDKDGNDNDVDCNNNNDEAISIDASSLPSNGSIRPDPNYNPARDPMNPINQNKPFIPPLDITIKTVRGRRRKYMRSAEQEQRGIEEQQQQQQDQDPSSSSSSLCRSPLPTASTPLQQQPEWLQLNSGGKQQRPRYHHQSPTLCRSPLPPPTLMIPVMNVGPSYTPTTPTTSCGGGNPLMIAAVQPTHSFTEVSKSTTTATTTRGSSITQLSLEEYQLNLHPSIYYDQEEPATTDLVNSDKFHSDNTTTTDINNNNINENIVLAQQQQNSKQRKGMVRRELTRRVFQFKKKKTNNETMIDKNNNSNNNTDHNAINGDDIDRAFGVIDTNAVVDGTEAEGVSGVAAADNDSKKNNTPTKNVILVTKKKNKSPYSIFSTINITGMMAKQGQENSNDNDNESSIVV